MHYRKMEEQDFKLLGDEQNDFLFNFKDERDQKIPCYIISAHSKLKFAWDIFIILLVFINCIAIPYEIAFPDTVLFKGYFIIGQVIDVCFIVDLILNFFTAFTNEKS